MIYGFNKPHTTTLLTDRHPSLPHTTLHFRWGSGWLQFHQHCISSCKATIISGPRTRLALNLLELRRHRLKAGEGWEPPPATSCLGGSSLS